MSENSKNVKASKSAGSVGYVANIALRLLVICAVVATLVAAVNALTKDKIALNARETAATALTRIYERDGMIFSVAEEGFTIADADGNAFGVCEDTTPLETLDDIDAVYTVRRADGSVFGYCVEASPMGFKDEVDLLVAVTPEGVLREVQILSLSDTKGIGDKVMQSDFLDPFKKKRSGFSKDPNTVSDLVIAGATRTSEPVTYAIDAALTQVSLLLNTTEELPYGE